ncbi:MAG: hypothetical protein BGO67_02235 [Alphaproteobacteria bacterium 41-28]|nr:MAG: hypothetical protein BGO67_02235 [Alphaproteobacteria bacterium 41-28]
MNINLLGYCSKITGIATLSLSLLILQIPSEALGAAKVQKRKATHSLKHVRQKRVRKRPSRSVSSKRKRVRTRVRTRKSRVMTRQTRRVRTKRVRPLRGAAARKQAIQTQFSFEPIVWQQPVQQPIVWQQPDPIQQQPIQQPIVWQQPVWQQPIQQQPVQPVAAEQQQTEPQDFAELTQRYLNPIRDIVANHIDFIKEPILDVLTYLGSYDPFGGNRSDDIKLLTSIAKRIKFQVEYWNAADMGFWNPRKSYFQKLKDDLQLGNGGKYAEYQLMMISCQNMIKSLLVDTGIPPIDETGVVPIPQRLKLNPWMINSPYIDALNANQGIRENDNAVVNEDEFIAARTKMVALFTRLRASGLITPLKLLDYEDVFIETRNRFENQAVHQNILDFLIAENAPHIPLATVDNLSSILGKTQITKNRTVALAKLIWTQNAGEAERQVISDDILASVLTRLAVGGRHCSYRAGEDTSWALARVANVELSASDQPLENKLAALMVTIKRKILDEMVNEERWAGQGNEEPQRLPGENDEQFDLRYAHWVNESRSQLTHAQQALEVDLGPHTGLSQSTGNFVYRGDILGKSVEEQLERFNAKYTQERIIEELVKDVSTSLKFKKLVHITLTADEERGKTPEQIEELKREKFYAQKNGTIGMDDFLRYFDRTSPAGRTADGIIDLDEETFTIPTFTEQNAKVLLHYTGHTERDDRDPIAAF